MFPYHRPTTSLRVIRPACAIACLLIVAVVPMPKVTASPVVIDFESVAPRDTSLGADFWVNNPGFTTGGATFSGGSYQGFAVSASTVTGTGGYFYAQAFGPASAAAEISAESNANAGGGLGGGQFAVGYNPGIMVDIPAGYRPASVYATNVATTAWLLANPDPNGFSNPLSQNGQEFSVTFRGWSQPGGQGSQLGLATFVLGRYSNGSASIVNDWTLVDLSNLGEAASIDFMFASYDENEFGIATPMYVALDTLTLTPVPEPSGLALLACAGVVGGVARWRRRGVRVA